MGYYPPKPVKTPRLASKGLSRLYTIELIEAWVREFGDTPVSSEDLLNSGMTGYYFLRAAGVAYPAYGRSQHEKNRMASWFAHFSKNPLPTRDGRNDGRLVEVGVDDDGLPTWTVRVRPSASEERRMLRPPEVVIT